MSYSNDISFGFSQTNNKRNWNFDADFLAETMTNIKNSVEVLRKKREEAKKEGYSVYEYCDYSQYWREYANEITLFYKQIIEKNLTDFSITYSFYNDCKTQEILNIFEEVKQTGLIKKCFAKDFPTIILFDKKENLICLTFSSNENFVPKIEKVPTPQEYLDNELYKKKQFYIEDYNNVQLFLKFQNKKCPIWKKKKFLAGKTVYDDIVRQTPIAPVVIDNSNQDKIKSYLEIENLIK